MVMVMVMVMVIVMVIYDGDGDNDGHICWPYIHFEVSFSFFFICFNTKRRPDNIPELQCEQRISDIVRVMMCNSVVSRGWRIAQTEKKIQKKLWGWLGVSVNR